MFRFLATLFLALALPTAAFSENFFEKEYPRSWSVTGVYATQFQNPACIAEYTGPEGRVQIIKDLWDGEVYMIAGHPSFNITDPLLTKRNGRVEFRGGSISATLPLEYLTGPNIIAFRQLDGLFLHAFMRTARMTIVLHNNVSITIPLRGSERAVKELATCLDTGLNLGETLFKNVPKKPQGTPI